MFHQFSIVFLFFSGKFFLLQHYFSTDWAVVSSANDDLAAEIKRCRCRCYCCQLKLQANDKVNLATVAAIEIDGVTRQIYDEHGFCICPYLDLVSVLILYSFIKFCSYCYLNMTIVSYSVNSSVAR